MTSRQIAAFVGYYFTILALTATVIFRMHQSPETSPAATSNLPDRSVPRFDDPNLQIDDYGFGHVFGPEFIVCFAPGTSKEYMEQIYNQLWADTPGPRFNAATRWSAINGSDGLNGSPQLLHWSLVPDGTPNVLDLNGANPVGSNLFSQLDARFSGSGGRATWVAKITQCFTRWDQISGLSYNRVIVSNDADDGATFVSSAGSPGVRGDCRIAMRTLDGGSGVLAYNYYPQTGDMVLDAGEGLSWASASGDYNFLRNIVMHEHGHGLGFAHVCPITTGKLMEPFYSSAFDGPQHDDIRAAQFNYGDADEQNDSVGAATNLGALNLGSPITRGQVPAPAVTNGSILSIDQAGGGDTDFFRFTTTGSRVLTATVSPVGLIYDSSVQNANGSCSSGNNINSLTFANLNIQILGSDGVTILATGASQPAGSAESVSNVQLLLPANYYVRVYSGSVVTQPQLYHLTLSVSDLDCNNNGVPDPQDVANQTSPDCDGNNIPDECQVPPICPTCLDCQSDGIPDLCQIPPICPTCPDCNNNAVPDACEVDCNSNGRPDNCDIALGSSPDCQPDNVPDECQVPPSCPSCPDCNANGLPDGCELASGALADCNTDGIPDRCQTDPLLCGGSCLPDCDANFTPDQCQLVGSFSQQSPDLSPIDFTSPQSYTLTAPPAAASDVTLEFRAVADLGSLSENINMDINGTPIGTLFGGTFDCLLVVQSITLPAATYNGIVNGGNAVIHMNPSVSVSPACAPSQISVKVDYATASGDCNSNTILDACEIASGGQTDCNANGIPDSCDITNGFLTDSDTNNIPDECDCNLLSCRGDLDLDALVNGNDVQVFITCLVAGDLATGCACADVNGDLQLNSADVQALVARLVLDPNLNCH